jgi:hypothetical protein
VQLVKTPDASPCTITFTANGQIAPLTVNVRLPVKAKGDRPPEPRP